MKPADKDILQTLAELECNAEAYSFTETEIFPLAAKHVTTFRRLVREAGYEIPADFDWQEHLGDEA